MCTETLQNFLDNQSINYDEVKLTREEKHITKAMGTKTPFLLTCAKEDQKLFSKLCLENEMKMKGKAEKRSHVLMESLFSQN